MESQVNLLQADSRNGEKIAFLMMVSSKFNYKFICSIVGACVLMILLGLTETCTYIKPICRPGDTNTQELYPIPPIAEVAGAFFFGFVAEIFGRKYAIMCLFTPLIVFSAIIEFCYVPLQEGATFFRSVSLGGALTIIPVYFGEIAEKKSRGGLIALLYSLYELGFFVFRSIRIYSVTTALSIAHCSVMVMGLTVGIMFAWKASESPAYYMFHKRFDHAKQTLKNIRNSNANTNQEWDELIGKNNGNGGNITIMPCLKKKGSFKAFVITIGMSFFNFLTGASVLNHFIRNAEVFETWHIPSGIAMCLVAFICPLLVDRIGRIKCLNISFVLIIASYLMSLIIDSLTDFNMYFAIFVVSIFYIGSNIGILPLQLVLKGELFPIKVKMVSAATATATYFTLDYISYSFIYHHSFSNYLVILCLAGCAVAFTNVRLFFLETKGKSLNEIQLILNRA